MTDKVNPQVIETLLSGSQIDKLDFYQFLEGLEAITSVLTGAVVPTFKARQHQWYLDTATNKYYRNVDGGTTWVALN